jgi:hypothetical protein
MRADRAITMRESTQRQREKGDECELPGHLVGRTLATNVVVRPHYPRSKLARLHNRVACSSSGRFDSHRASVTLIGRQVAGYRLSHRIPRGRSSVSSCGTARYPRQKCLGCVQARGAISVHARCAAQISAPGFPIRALRALKGQTANVPAYREVFR